MNKAVLKDSKIYLTFDFDWAIEEVIKELVDFLKEESVKATFFITNNFNGLSELMENEQFEVGVHPNFTPLPQDEIYHSDFISNAEMILDDLLQIVPGAKAVRAHGLTQNTRILDLFKNKGFTHESNLLIPLSSNVILKPYYHWNKLIRIPFIWEDDIFLEEMRLGNYSSWEVTPFLYTAGLKVFNFHPIHCCINTEKMSRYYELGRLNNYESIKRCKNLCNDIGIHTFLQELILKAKKGGYEFGKITELYPDAERGM